MSASSNNRRSYEYVQPAKASRHGEFRIPALLVMQPSVPPEAILIIRDLLRGKPQFRSQPFKRGKSLRSGHGRELLAGDRVSAGRFDPKNLTLPSQPPDPRF
jgi:hypothetical protein